MVVRLEAAERVYKFLNLTDHDWCHFYRVMGYHYAEAGLTTEAATARARALDLADAMLQNPSLSGTHKELLVIKGAMHILLNDPEQGMVSLRESRHLNSASEEQSDEDASKWDEYLNKVSVDLEQTPSAAHHSKQATSLLKEL